MQFNQMYALINDINNQMWGKDALQTNDLSGIFALGEALSGSSLEKEKYLNKLVDRIGKTVIRTLDYELKFPNLFANEHEYGNYIQKITVNPYSAIQASEFTVGENDFTPTYDSIHKPENVFVTYFKDGVDVFKFFVTIPDELFQSAFTSESEMSKFIDAIVGALSDSMILAIDDLARTAVNEFIAEKIIMGNGIINLVEMYNSAYGLTGDDAKTADECLVDKEFYRYSTTIIRQYIRYISEISALYNVGDVEGNPIFRATSRDNCHVLMLSAFKYGIDAYLIADSFRDVYGMPLFTEYSYLQSNKGANTINDFDTISSIDIVPSSQKKVTTPSDRYAIQQKGIVCAIFDRQAVFTGLNKRRAGSFVNTIDGYSNLSMTAKKQYCVDLSENGIIFLVADSVVTPKITVDKSALTFANSSADAQTITATTMPSDATVTWSTSKASVATVSDGVVSPVGTGTCKITAKITVGGTDYKAVTDVTVG